MPKLFFPLCLIFYIRTRLNTLCLSYNAFNDLGVFPFEDSGLLWRRVGLFYCWDVMIKNPAQTQPRKHPHNTSTQIPLFAWWGPRGQNEEVVSNHASKPWYETVTSPPKKDKHQPSFVKHKERPLPLTANFIKSSLLNYNHKRIFFFPFFPSTKA